MSSTSQAPQEGQKITLLLHESEYPAVITSVDEDGFANVMALSKFGHMFPKNRVGRALVTPVSKHARDTPYWTEASTDAPAPDLREARAALHSAAHPRQ